jgi:hypothetical protein
MGRRKFSVTHPGRKLSERGLMFLMAGLVLLVGTVSYFWHSTSPDQAGSGSPAVSQAMVPLVTGEEPVDQIFSHAGCVVCHAIPGISGAAGKVGPRLILGETGPQRLADPNYHGTAKTVREYIQESILLPGAYVVPGYPDQVMPRWYGQKLSAAALDKIAGYLEGLSADR